MLFATLRAVPSQAVTDRAMQFAWRLAGATDIPPAEVPAFVEETIRQFPELRVSAGTFRCRAAV